MYRSSFVQEGTYQKLTWSWVKYIKSLCVSHQAWLAPWGTSCGVSASGLSSAMVFQILPAEGFVSSKRCPTPRASLVHPVSRRAQRGSPRTAVYRLSRGLVLVICKISTFRLVITGVYNRFGICFQNSSSKGKMNRKAWMLEQSKQ